MKVMKEITSGATRTHNLSYEDDNSSGNQEANGTPSKAGSGVEAPVLEANRNFGFEVNESLDNQGSAAANGKLPPVEIEVGISVTEEGMLRIFFGEPARASEIPPGIQSPDLNQPGVIVAKRAKKAKAKAETFKRREVAYAIREARYAGIDGKRVANAPKGLPESKECNCEGEVSPIVSELQPIEDTQQGNLHWSPAECFCCFRKGGKIKYKKPL